MSDKKIEACSEFYELMEKIAKENDIAIEMNNVNINFDWKALKIEWK